MERHTWQDDMVSVIMPAYNSEEYIRESIESVLVQTYSNWELLIVDDGSTDKTASIVQEYKDIRIHYLHQSNCGVAAARNHGIREARGRYVAFLDSDDLWLPDKLNRQLQFMKKKAIGFSYTWYCQFQETPVNCGAIVQTKSNVNYQELLKGNDIGCLTVMLDRQKYPLIEMPLVRHEDYVTWLNLLKQGDRAYSLPLDLARYRKQKTSLTGSKWRSMQWTWQVYRKTQKLSVITSVAYFVIYMIKGIQKHYLK